MHMMTRVKLIDVDTDIEDLGIVTTGPSSIVFHTKRPETERASIEYELCEITKLNFVHLYMNTDDDETKRQMNADGFIAKEN